MNLNRKVGSMNYDGLITGLVEEVRSDGRTIAKGSTEVTYKRGTVFARSVTDGKLYILGSAPASGDTLTPDCILPDDTEVGTGADVNVAAYTGGRFDPGKVIVKDGHTMTNAERDALRIRNIEFTAAFEAN